MTVKKTKPSITDLSFRIPGYIMILGFIAEYDLAKSNVALPTVTIGDKTFPVFSSIGYAGLFISLLPYLIMGWNAYTEWKKK